MKVREIFHLLDKLAPFSLQESYDNSGLQLGHMDAETKKCLVCLDVTEDVIREAIAEDCTLIISHHPLIFGSLKKLTGQTAVEKCIELAIMHQIAIISVHTNLDNASDGLNTIICHKLGLEPAGVLNPLKGRLRKLVTFCPSGHADKVRQAIFEAGAGHIGKYDQCSYNIEGTGTFRAGAGTNPFVGETGKLHFEDEIRIETIFPDFFENDIVRAMKDVHPYEEVAFDIYPLENEYHGAGAGMIGVLPDPVKENAFLDRIKQTLGIPFLRHSEFLDKPVKRVAVCGGSGSFLVPNAIAANADMFVTADMKYHHFFSAEGKIVLVDVGHFESEQFAVELMAGYLKGKIPNFAVLISGVNTNPIRYY